MPMAEETDSSPNPTTLSVAALQAENARQFQEIEQLTQELAEALERQTATADVLRVISESPNDLGRVLDELAPTCLRLAKADSLIVTQREGDGVITIAAAGRVDPDTLAEVEAVRAAGVGSIGSRSTPAPAPPIHTVISLGSTAGRAILERRTILVDDFAAVRAVQFPGVPAERVVGDRSVASLPLLSGGEPIGALRVARSWVQPFSPGEVQLLESFADQAVIAIENTRLFTELQERNRDLGESLAQQRAISAILQVITSSPTDVQPVLQAIVDQAEQLPGLSHASIILFEGDVAFIRARGPRMAAAVARGEGVAEDRHPLVRANIPGKVFLQRRTIHLVEPSAHADPDDPDYDLPAIQAGLGVVLAVPLVHEDAVIGTILEERLEVMPYTEREITLFETFARQAAIAIANTNLFHELQERNREVQEALQQQTATAEVLQTISRSAFDLQHVLDTLAESATRLCAADISTISRLEADGVRFVAFHGAPPELEAVMRRLHVQPGRDSGMGRLLLERQPIHIPDVLAEPDYEMFEARQAGGYRAALVVPLLRGDELIGGISLVRTRPEAFTEAQIKLVTTFANQAVIAIENTRLLTELQQRLEEQTATAEILRTISESPTDLTAVLHSIVERAGRLCVASDCFVLVAAPDGVRVAAAAGPMATAFSTAYENRPIFPVSRRSVTGRAMLEQRTNRVDDVGPLLDSEYPDARDGHDRFGTRSYVAVPLLRSNALLGAITAIRTEVRPFSDRDVGLLQSFADQAVIALENARLLTELQNRTQELTHSVEQLKAVLEVGQVVSSTLDVEAVLSTISAHAATLSGADGGAIFELDPATQQLNLRSSYNQGSELLTVLREAPLHVGEGAGGRAVATRQAVQIPDAAVEGAYQSSVREILLQSGFRALLAVPLLHESQVLGALVLNRKTSGEFAPEVVELVKTFASQSAISLQNARLFQELAAKGRELAAASQHKSEFLATMSHELRTPLNAVIGMTGILLDTGLDQRQREYATIIRNSGETLLTIINDILDFSKIEAGKLDLEMRPFDLRECVESALDLVTAEAARKGLDLAYHLDEQTPTAIVGDVTRLRQVLLNLLNNAVKFTAAGEVFLAVDRQPATDPTSPTAPDEGHCELHFAVRDTGIGIPRIA
jgi:GAF domain-containing protein